MRKTLAWSKANPIIVVALVLAVAALGIMAYVSYSGSVFVDLTKRRQEDMLKKTEGYITHPVSIPSPGSLGQPSSRFLTVRDSFIDYMKDLYKSFDDQYIQVSNLIDARNKGGHDVAVPGLFPGAAGDPTRDYAMLVAARDIYRLALTSSFLVNANDRTRGRANRAPWHLVVDLPPSAKELNELAKGIEQKFRSKLVPPVPSPAKLPTSKQKQLNETTSREVLDRLVGKARSCQLYAQANAGPTAAAPGAGDADTAFPIGPMPAWFASTVNVERADVWETQMQLWITQDLITAIGLTNKVYKFDTGPNGERTLVANVAGVNVVDAPIKHLLVLKVLPGYAGIEVNNAAAPSGRSGTDFAPTPTGRISHRGDAIYDVKHAVLSVIIDDQHIPELLNSLARVNFMSVVKLRTTAIDSYDEMKKGFYYGPQSCVKLDLLIETLWFRDWTKQLMPPKVQAALGMAGGGAPTPTRR